MFEKIFLIIIAIIFSLFIFIEYKKYQLRLTRLKEEYEASLKTIEDYDSDQNNEALDVHKEMLYRLKRDALQKEIDQSFENNDGSQN